MSSHDPAGTGAPDHPPLSTTANAGRAGPTGVTAPGSARPSDPGALRELIIESGLDLLTRDGLHLAARSLGYGSVLAHLQETHGIKVGRASIHERIWASNAEFRAEVIEAALGHLSADFLGARGAAVRDTVVDINERNLAAGDRMAEFGRRMAPVVFSGAADLPGFRNTQLAKALASSINDPETARALGHAVDQRGEAVVEALTARFTLLTSRLRFRPRSDLGLDGDRVHRLISAISASFIIGGCLDQAVDNHLLTEPLPLGGHQADDPAPWTSIGVGLWSYFRCLYQDAGTPPDDSVPPLPPPGPMTAPSIDSTNGRRRQRQELRDLVLGAGVEVLLSQRFDLRPGTLAYTTVFDHIERLHGFRLYRSTVHNSLWASHLEYWLEVLGRAAGSDPDLCPATEEILADAAGERPLPARLLILAVMSAEADATTVAPAAIRRQLIKASLLSEPPSPPIDALRAQMRHRDQRRVASLATALRRALVDSGRYRVRPEVGSDPEQALAIVARVGLTVLTGNLFDQAAGITAAAETFAIRDPDGGVATWPIPAVATWACFDALFAPTAAQEEVDAAASMSSTRPSA